MKEMANLNQKAIETWNEKMIKFRNQYIWSFFLKLI